MSTAYSPAQYYNGPANRSPTACIKARSGNQYFKYASNGWLIGLYGCAGCTIHQWVLGIK
jgi:hypothetical protein